MIDTSTIAAAVGVPCLISGNMQQQMQLWEDLYQNRAGWQKKRIKPMKLPSAIIRELKRLTLTEFHASVNDVNIDAAFQKTIPVLRRSMDMGLAMGGMLLKPCFSGGVMVDIVPQSAYLPVKYTDTFCDSVICPEELAIGKSYYTRLEYHVYDRSTLTHTITQCCFKSGMPGVLGTECRLSEVPEWADILPEKVYENAKRPLFAVFQVPDANNIDPASPLGVSVYADAIHFIRDADEHWERILWELESSERAIDATEDLFRYKDGKPVLPRGRERMFRSYEKTEGQSFINTFSPEVRDTSYFHALNQIFRRIENAVGLSYGTLSEVSDVEKTAEEVKFSKQRSFVRVNDIQENLRVSLEQLVYGIQYYHDYYANRTRSPAVLTCTFGDGVLEDFEKEYQRRSQMVRDRILKPELFLSWYFGCTPEEALNMLPEQQNDGGLFSGGGF